MPQDEHHLDQVMKNGLYQSQQRRQSLEGLTPGGLALDVGAHVGLWLRDLCDHFDHVIAFEPIDSHRQCLVENISKTNYTLRSEVIGADVGLSDMQTYVGNTGHAHRRQGLTYPMISIDSLGLDQVKFIKIDVEGWELDVCLGAEETIRRSRPRLCIEQKPHREGDQYEARDRLISWGYRTIKHHGDDWVLDYETL